MILFKKFLITCMIFVTFIVCSIILFTSTNMIESAGKMILYILITGTVGVWSFGYVICNVACIIEKGKEEYLSYDTLIDYFEDLGVVLQWGIGIIVTILLSSVIAFIYIIINTW